MSFYRPDISDKEITISCKQDHPFGYKAGIHYKMVRNTKFPSYSSTPINEYRVYLDSLSFGNKKYSYSFYDIEHSNNEELIYNNFFINIQDDRKRKILDILNM